MIKNKRLFRVRQPSSKFAAFLFACIAWCAVGAAICVIAAAYTGQSISFAPIGDHRLTALCICLGISVIFVKPGRKKLVSPENMLLAAFWFYYFLGFFTRNAFFRDDYYLYSVCIVIAGLVSALVGSSSGRFIFASGGRPMAADSALASQVLSRRRNSVRSIKVLLPASVLISLVAGIVWYRTIGVIPIFSADVEHARIDLAQGTFVIRQFMTLGVAPFWLALSLGGSKVFGKFVFYTAFIVISFLLVSQGYRSFLLSFWLISLLIKTRNNLAGVSIKKVAIVAGVVIAFALSFGVFRYETSSSADAARDVYMVAAENFYARPEATDYIVREFPADRPYQYGYFYVMGLGFILPGQQKSPGTWLKEDVFGLDFAGAGLNPGIVGEFYLNFGLPGVIFGMFFYGMALSLLWIRLPRRGNEISLSMQCMAFFYLLLAVSPGISTSLVSLFWYGGTIWVFGFLSRIRSKKRLAVGFLAVSEPADGCHNPLAISHCRQRVW